MPPVRKMVAPEKVEASEGYLECVVFFFFRERERKGGERNRDKARELERRRGREEREKGEERGERERERGEGELSATGMATEKDAGGEACRLSFSMLPPARQTPKFYSFRDVVRS